MFVRPFARREANMMLLWWHVCGKQRLLPPADVRLGRYQFSGCVCLPLSSCRWVCGCHPDSVNISLCPRNGFHMHPQQQGERFVRRDAILDANWTNRTLCDSECKYCYLILSDWPFHLHSTWYSQTDIEENPPVTHHKPGEVQRGEVRLFSKAAAGIDWQVILAALVGRVFMHVCAESLCPMWARVSEGVCQREWNNRSCMNHEGKTCAAQSELSKWSRILRLFWGSARMGLVQWEHPRWSDQYLTYFTGCPSIILLFLRMIQSPHEY